jgi:hypothetical protein
MEEQVIEFVSDIPTWIWVIVGLFLFVRIFGDRELWDYEVEFPPLEGIGKGEIDFTCYKKKGSVLEIELELSSQFSNHEIEICLNGSLVYTLGKEKNPGGKIFHKEKMPLQEPAPGDEVTVNIAGRNIFRGQLIKE